MRIMYENCTRVYGNLEITHLTRATLGLNKINFKRKLGIFDHIEEIKGYILIYNVDLQMIEFPKLKMIWGDDLLDDSYALTLSSNKDLTEVRMPKLRDLERFEDDTFQLLDFEANKRLEVSPTAYRQCSDANGNPIATCHQKCKGHCWGQKKEAFCQENNSTS
uniref:Recep_L_domain domain-containing protein n=1 Tax=Heterorhabditis bacteriophora TaxID=37862 RepID=A0A1I7XMF3_HETBA